MPSETLLPCPFCGGTAELWRAHPGDAVLPKLTAFVGCMGECATVVTRGFETDAEAIATWNRRAAHQERDADARRLDWLEGMSATAEHHSGHWFLSWPIYAGGPRAGRQRTRTGPTLRAAIDAAMAPDTQTEAAPAEREGGQGDSE